MLPRYLRRPKYIFFGVVFVILVGVMFTFRGKSTWVPDADCDKAGLTVPDGDVPKGAKVYWVATGPTGRYVVTAGVEQITIDEDQRVSVVRAEPGADPVTGLTDLAGCRKSGSIDGVFPTGSYTLRLFRIEGLKISEVARRDFRIRG